METIAISCYLLNVKQAVKFLTAFGSALNQSINKVHDTHAIATHGVGYPTPCIRSALGRANPLSTQEFLKGVLTQRKTFSIV